MIKQPYIQMIDVKRWADQNLCAAITSNWSQLEDEETNLLRRVVDHIYVVDRIFQHHLKGRPHAYRAAQSETLPSFEVLAWGLRETGAWYADYVRSEDWDALDQPIDFVFTSGKPARMTRGEMLLHVCIHGAYHRGNAGALLQLKGLAPGRDSVTDFLEAAA